MKKLIISILGVFTLFSFISAYNLTSSDQTIITIFEEGIKQKGSEYTLKISNLFSLALEKNILDTRKTAIVVELLKRLEPIKPEITYIPEGLLDAVNLERSRLGLSNLTLNNKLNQAAYNHANYMKDVKIFDHIGENNSTPADRVNNEGYTRSYVAENIARGHTSVDQVMQARMNSLGHKANILSENATEIGLAMVDKYRVQVFASPR